MNEKEYRALTDISQSDCKAILSMSGQEYLHYKVEGILETPAMFRGTMVHGICLENKVNMAKYYAIDDWPERTGKDRRGNAYKDFKAGLVASGKPIVKASDIALTTEMLHTVNRDFGKLLREGKPEYAITGRELSPGVKCKGRIDFLPEKHFIFDLKTTGKPLNDRQMWAFLNYDGWRIQAAFYHDLVLDLTGESRPFVFLIVSDKAPYSTRKLLVEPHSKAMALGREEYMRAIDIYKSYVSLAESDKGWPGWGMFKTHEMEQKSERS